MVAGLYSRPEATIIGVSVGGAPATGARPRVLTSSWSATSPGVCRATRAQHKAPVFLFLSFMGGGAEFLRHRVRETKVFRK